MAHMVGHSMMGASGGSRKPTQAPVASRSTKPEAGQAIEARLPAALLTAPEPNNVLSRYEAEDETGRRPMRRGGRVETGPQATSEALTGVVTGNHLRLLLTGPGQSRTETDLRFDVCSFCV